MSLSADRALRKARSHSRKREFHLAIEQYKNILERFPKNKRAIEGLRALQSPTEKDNSTGSAEFQTRFTGLVELFNQGKLQQALVDGVVGGADTC